EERKIKYWVAPMDPTYIQKEPGKSPMGMELVPVYEDGNEESREDENAIKIDPSVVQNIGVRTTVVEKRPLRKIIRTMGLIDYDETKYTHVHSKIQGWVEEMYVDYTGQKVSKGQPLLAIYSPELVSTQEEYLTAIKAGRGSAIKGSFAASRDALVRSTRQRLAYWDITEEQIDILETSGQVTKLMTLYSPFDGIVVHKNALNGMEVKSGMALYQIADLSTVWVYAEIYEYEIPWLEEGLEAEMSLSYAPGKIFKGEVSYVYPFLDPKTRTVKVRLEFNNEKFDLKPGMYTNVNIFPVVKEETVVVSGNVVIRSGEREVVFVKVDKGKYIPREITLGAEGEDGFYQVLEGLEEGEEIVITSQFLLDSESSLREVALRRLAAMSESGVTEVAPFEQDTNMIMPESEEKPKNNSNHDN
ncbi:MAG: efflux RND transporter periplasmic adaptor subunit, partial [Nitrospinota bacterium]